MTEPEKRRQCQSCSAELPEESDDLLCGDCLERETMAADAPGTSSGEGRSGIPTPRPESAVSLSPGNSIGPYHLREKLGEGGFGIVFRAEQTEPVRREVALKVIKPGMGSEEIVARFKAERQALALMDHPHIAKVYDAGTTGDGLPFFVMELVDGLPLNRYCEERGLGLSARIALMEQVCSAVQHAHRKGVLHRDLKPGNVLVSDLDGKPVPKVIDFGIAKALGERLTDQTLMTAEGAFIGTPLYMSPEQMSFSGDVDTRSDLYALGVMLYELVTGSLPFPPERLRAAAFDEVCRMIREDEPPKPSTRVSQLEPETATGFARNLGTDLRSVRRELRGELDWVIMKALAKDRDQRYESVTGLENDLAALLANEPVAAGPPSKLYQTRKFIRRNRAAVTSASLIVIFLTAGLHLTTWLAIRARAAEARAELEREEAEEILRFMTFEVRDKLRSHVPLSTRREILEKVEDYYERTGRHRGGESLYRLVAHFESMGSQAHEAGELEAAGRAFDRAHRLVTRLLTEEPDNIRWKRGLAAIESKLGMLDHSLGNSPEAEAHFSEALSIQGELIEIDPDDPTDRLMFSRGLSLLSKVKDRQGRKDEAIADRKLSIEIDERLAGEAEPDPRVFVQLRGNYIEMGRLMNSRGSPEEALAYLEKSFRVSERLLADDPQNLDYRYFVALDCQDLGRIHRHLGRLEESATFLTRAIGLWETLHETDPDQMKFAGGLSGAHRELGMVRKYQKRHDDALQNQEKALAIRKKLHAISPDNLNAASDLAVTHENLGNALEDLRRPEEALAHYRAGLAIAEKIVTDDPEDRNFLATLCGITTATADVLQKLDRPEETLEFRERAVTFARKLFAMDSTMMSSRILLAISQLELARMFLDDDDLGCMKLFEEAAEHFSVLSAIPGRKRTTFLNRLSDAHYELGKFLMARDRKSEALPRFAAAREVCATLLEGKPRQLSLQTRVSLCFGYEGMLMEDEAKSLESFEHQIENTLLTRKLFPRIRRQASLLANGYFNAAGSHWKLAKRASSEEEAAHHRTTCFEYHRKAQELLEWLGEANIASDLDRETLSDIREFLEKTGP